MPDAAIKAVPTAEVIPLNGLAPRLIDLSREGVKAKRSAAV
jgi:hypothetical protein